MKKILSCLFFAFYGFFINKSIAQCNGASVLITNIVVTNSGSTYTYSYDWQYVNGNASILVVLKCNGVVVAESLCNDDLKTKSGSSTTTTFSEAGSITYSTSCSGIKEVEVRVYASQNCGGTFCPIGQIVLPVKLTYFNAKRNSQSVKLTWETASEEKNRGFDVQRFIGSGNWESVGFVSSKATDGFSSSSLNYDFVDINNIKGITQYRLKLVDMDGKSAFSLIRSIRGEGQSGKTIIYPNPTSNGKVNVVFDDGNVTRDVTLVDMNGRTIRQWRGTTNNNIQIENLNAGFYSVIILNRETGKELVEKIVVVQ